MTLCTSIQDTFLDSNSAPGAKFTEDEVDIEHRPLFS